MRMSRYGRWAMGDGARGATACHPDERKRKRREEGSALATREKSKSGATSQSARSPKRREVPDDANSQEALCSKRRRQTAQSPERRSSALGAVRDFAPFGSSRSRGLRAVRDFAPFGTSRSLAYYYSPRDRPRDRIQGLECGRHGVRREARLT